MHLKGALHVHTTCSDGELTVAETIEIHEQLGFDFIALTDHDYLIRPDCYDELYRIRTDMIVFTGKELTVFESGYCHVSQIEGDRERLYIFNHPAQLDLPLSKVVERIQNVAEQYPLDAVELTTYGFPTPEYDVPEIPYPKVATDDSHTRAMCGRAWIEMDAPRDKDAIIRAVRAGEFSNCFQS
jgi:hypothetical protein